MNDWIKSKPLRWFYVVMALLLFVASLQFFYMAAKHATFIERLPWAIPGALLAQHGPEKSGASDRRILRSMTHPAQAKRLAALEALILAAVHPIPRNGYEIRRFVLSCEGFDWASPLLVTKTFVRMEGQRRLELVFVDGMSVPVYRLPEDPTNGFSRFPTTAEGIAERERKILQTMNWPRFFHIPTKEELRPDRKTRTGYDVREDMNRF